MPLFVIGKERLLGATPKGVVPIVTAPEKNDSRVLHVHQPLNTTTKNRYRRISGSEIGALIVALNEYGPGRESWTLRQCVRDAHKMRNLLIDSYGVPEKNIKLLINESATKHNIVREMKRINSEFRWRYYGHSGHGYRSFNEDEGRYVEGLVVYGQAWSRANMLLDVDIMHFLGGPERTWCMIDACHSGGLLDKALARDVSVRMKFIEAPKKIRLGDTAIATPKDFCWLLACGKTEVSYEDSNGGAFISAVYDAWSHRPELSYAQLAESAKNKIKYNQNPVILCPEMDAGMFQVPAEF